HQDLPFSLVELRQSLLHPEGCVWRILKRPLRIGRRRRPHLGLLSPLGRQQLPRNAVKVGSDQRPRLEARCPPNHGQEGLLGEFLGALAARQTAAEKAAQRLAIAREQFFESLARPALEFEHQRIRRSTWRVHHLQCRLRRKSSRTRSRPPKIFLITYNHGIYAKRPLSPIPVFEIPHAKMRAKEGLFVLLQRAEQIRKERFHS